MTDPTDEVLMQRYCEGDNAALATLFDRHATGVQGFLTRMVRNEALADDLLQATFLSLVRSADRYRRGSAFRPWLLTIAANAARDALRRNRLGVEVLANDEVLPDIAVHHEPSDPAVRARIEAAFARLPPQQREAVLLHKVEGLTFTQVAEALDISETAARIRAHRGYEKLRELLGEFA